MSMIANMIMVNLHTALSFCARLMLVSYFLTAGISNLRKPGSIVGMIKSKNVPLPMVAMVGVFVIQLIGSLMVVFNWYAAIGAIGLFVFTLASNLLFCTFWNMEGLPRQLTKFLFSANIAIMGGLLLIIAAN